MKKLKYRDYKWYAQGLTAIKWQSQAVGSMWSHLKSNSWRAVSSNGPQQNCKVGGLLSLPPPLFWSPFFQSLVIFHFCMFSNFLFMSNNLTQLSVFPKHHSTKKEREKEKEKKKTRKYLLIRPFFIWKLLQQWHLPEPEIGKGSRKVGEGVSVFMAVWEVMPK